MDIIGDLLRSSLLSDLADDQARVEKVRAAADGMARLFVGESRPLVPAAVFAGFDEHTAADSTALTVAAEQVLVEWETFRNAFAGTPIEVLRAVALAAAVAAAGDEPAVLQAAWYTARTATEQIPTGRWSGPLATILEAWHRGAGEAIADTWVPRIDAVTLRMPGLQIPDDQELTVDSPLREKAADLPTDNWQTAAQHVMPAFAEYVDGLLGAAEDVAAEAQRRSLMQVKDFAKELGGRLRTAINAQEQALAAIHLRTDLLWWRQSLYSDRVDAGYMDLASAADIAIAAAHDLHLRMPAIAPVAVEHVLADLVHETAGTTSLGLADLKAAAEASALPPAETPPPVPALLLDAVTKDVLTPVLADNSKLQPARAAVVLFRDLQARRLATAPPAPTRS